MNTQSRNGRILGTIMLATLLTAPPLRATEPAVHASLTFHETGNIRSWQPVGHDALLIESGAGQWYRAEFAAPCGGLPFAMSVSFVTEPDGRLDQYSSILVEGEQCWFRDVQKVTEPNSREGRHATGLLR
jgi:Family of unknown function (DUF6491)